MTHLRIVTPAEQSFDASLRAERDRLSAELDRRPNLYRKLDEAARIAAASADAERDFRILRWQTRIKWGAILLAYCAIVYFAFQFGRGA